MPNQTSLPFFFHQQNPSKVNGMEGPPKHLSREAIEEFKTIYQEEFHKNLSNDEAQEIALRLLRLFDILLQPFPSDTADQTVIR